MNRRIERGRKAHRLGHLAETRCVWFLRLKGYRILFRRFQTPVGEIDIIARHGGTLVFVEVKARASVDAAAASLPKSLARMQRAVDYYLARHGVDGMPNLRMDVMFVTPSSLWPVHVQDGIGVRGL